MLSSKHPFFLLSFNGFALCLLQCASIEFIYAKRWSGMYKSIFTRGLPLIEFVQSSSISDAPVRIRIAICDGCLMHLTNHLLLFEKMCLCFFECRIFWWWLSSKSFRYTFRQLLTQPTIYTCSLPMHNLKSVCWHIWEHTKDAALCILEMASMCDTLRQASISSPL